MTSTLLLLALLFLANGDSTLFEGKRARVVNVTRIRDGTPGETVRVSRKQSDAIVKLLARGKREPTVFLPDYTIQLVVRHTSVTLLVNGQHFKMDGVTFVTAEDLSKVLETLRK